MKLKALFYQNPAGFSAAILMLAAAVCGYFVNRQSFIILLISFVVVLVVDMLYAVLSLKSTRKYVNAVNDALLTGTSSTVDDFPLPTVICDKYGNLVWYNKQFSEDVVKSCEIKNLSMKDFFDDFSYEKYSNEKIVNGSFEDNQYTAFVVNAKSETNPMLCFYLFDDTALKEIALEYTYSRPFVMLITVDNIEQLARQLTDSKFALVLSGIESRIEGWLKAENVVLKKIGNGNFLVIGEKRNLDSLSEKKFSVLNEVRGYTYEDVSVNATLSIGVGSGENFSECESRAKKALDMALGRGGDQAAIFSENGYVYFGGVSNRVNDNNRVSPRQTAANISTLIKKHNKAIIMGHKYSDCDAIGAALGMYFFAESCGVDAFVAVDSKTTLATPLIEMFEEKGFKHFISTSKALDMCKDDTVVIVVDTQRKALTESPDLYDLAGSTIVIDHHRRTEDYISDADISYSVPSASSTCEMVSELIQYSTIQDNPSADIATALFSGIVLDTKDFVLRTSQRTFEAAGFLRDSGADTVQVKKFFAIDAEMVSLKNEIISGSKIFNGFIIGVCNADNKNIRIVTSSAADDMLNIDGVKASFVISKLGLGKYQISARSLGEENVQLIMEQLNGGGHITMAAAQVKASDAEGVKALLLDAINEYLNNK